MSSCLIIGSSSKNAPERTVALLKLTTSAGADVVFGAPNPWLERLIHVIDTTVSARNRAGVLIEEATWPTLIEQAFGGDRSVSASVLDFDVHCIVGKLPIADEEAVKTSDILTLMRDGMVVQVGGRGPGDTENRGSPRDRSGADVEQLRHQLATERRLRLDAERERDAFLALSLPTTEASKQLRHAVADGHAEVEARVAGLVELAHVVQANTLRREVLACGLDYEGAFAKLKAAQPKNGAEIITAAFQDYLSLLRTLLFEKPEEQGRGHFGSLEANKAFSKQLNEMLDLTNLRLHTERGSAMLTVAVRERGQAAGYFSFGLRPSGSTGASKMLPALVLRNHSQGG